MNNIDRAPKGGCLGINKEWYEGGKFLPQIPRQKQKGSKPKKAMGKQCIAPYKWVKSENNSLSIYTQIELFLTVEYPTGETLWDDPVSYRADQKFNPEIMKRHAQAMGWDEEYQKRLLSLAGSWEKGQNFFSVNEETKELTFYKN